MHAFVHSSVLGFLMTEISHMQKSCSIISTSEFTTYLSSNVNQFSEEEGPDLPDDQGCQSYHPWIALHRSSLQCMTVACPPSTWTCLVVLAAPSSVHDSETAASLPCIPQRVGNLWFPWPSFSCFSYVSVWNVLLSAYICICMYMGMYTYINVCTRVCPCACEFACAHICMLVCVYVHASKRQGSTGCVRTRSFTLLWRTTVQKVEEQAAHEHAPSADWNR